jgi:hypothetical protein
MDWSPMLPKNDEYVVGILITIAILNVSEIILLRKSLA